MKKPRKIFSFGFQTSENQNWQQTSTFGLLAHQAKRTIVHCCDVKLLGGGVIEFSRYWVFCHEVKHSEDLKGCQMQHWYLCREGRLIWPNPLPVFETRVSLEKKQQMGNLGLGKQGRCSYIRALSHIKGSFLSQTCNGEDPYRVQWLR